MNMRIGELWRFLGREDRVFVAGMLTSLTLLLISLALIWWVILA